MSYWDGQPDQNITPTAADGITAGPQTGFMANFHAAFSDAYHVHSALAAQEDMSNLEQQNLDALYKATGTRLPPVFPGAFYGPQDASGPFQQDIMHVFAGDVGDYGAANAAQMQKEYRDTAQAQIEKYDTLAQQHGLPTYEQMFKQVQQNAQASEADAQDVGSRATTTGWLGGIAGGVAGSMFPNRDPINFATLALGGAGKSILARTAAQVGMNSVAAAGELLSGGADTQKLLTGQAPTAGEEAAQIGLAGAGAGLLHLGGEAVGAGFRAVARRFGAAAPDLTSAALAKEAEDAIGPSPYGDSRVAQGLHTGEVLDALRRDTPLNMRSLMQDQPEFAISSLAGRNSDSLFTGTSQPLRNLFDDLPKGVNAGRTNQALSDITGRIDANTQAAKQLDDQIAARTGADDYDPGAAKRTQAQLTALNQQIADTTDARKLGQLNRDKAQLEVALSRAEAVNNDLKAMIGQRDGINQAGDAMRLQRAQIVADAVKGKPGIRKSAVASTLLDGDRVRATDVASSRPPSVADAIEQEISKPAPEPTPESAPKPRIIVPEQPKQVEGQPEPKLLPPPGEKGSGEMVEVGQRSGAIDMDTFIPWGKDADGNQVMRTPRDILKELDSHDALYRAMTECMI